MPRPSHSHFHASRSVAWSAATTVRTACAFVSAVTRRIPNGTPDATPSGGMSSC